MLQPFKSMEDLTSYLTGVEERIKSLEAENTTLRSSLAEKKTIDGNVIARYVVKSLPQTNLLSPGFFRRAFAVWGHFFVANLIIGTIVFIGYLCLMTVLFGSVLGNLIHQANP